MKNLEEIEITKKNLSDKVKVLIGIKNKKFSNIDISLPMCDEEKSLTKEITQIWGEINNLVRMKNKLKKNSN